MPIYQAVVLTSKVDGISPSLVLTCGSKNSIANGKEMWCLHRIKCCLFKNNGEGGVWFQYLFNLPESLDRLAGDQGIPLNDVTAVFAPEVSTKAMGGLGSRLFRSQTHRALQIISPSGMGDWLNAVRLISGKLSGLQLDHFVISANGKAFCYKDPFIKVAAIHEHDKEVALPSWLGPDCNPQVKVQVANDGFKSMPNTGESSRRGTYDETENPEVIAISLSDDCSSEKNPRAKNGDVSCVDSLENNPESVPASHPAPSKVQNGVQSSQCGSEKPKVARDDTNIEEAGKKLPRGGEKDTKLGLLDILHQSLMRCIVLRSKAVAKRHLRGAKDWLSRTENRTKTGDGEQRSSRKRPSHDSQAANEKNYGGPTQRRLNPFFPRQERAVSESMNTTGQDRKMIELVTLRGNGSHKGTDAMLSASKNDVEKVNWRASMSLPSEKKVLDSGGGIVDDELREGRSSCAVAPADRKGLVEGTAGVGVGRWVPESVQLEMQNENMELIDLMSNSDCESISEIVMDSEKYQGVGKDVEEGESKAAVPSDRGVVRKRIDSGDGRTMPLQDVGARKMDAGSPAGQVANPEVVELSSSSSESCADGLELQENPKSPPDPSEIHIAKKLRRNEPSAAEVDGFDNDQCLDEDSNTKTWDFIPVPQPPPRKIKRPSQKKSKQLPSFSKKNPVLGNDVDADSPDCGATLLTPSGDIDVDALLVSTTKPQIAENCEGCALAFVVNIVATDRLVVVVFGKEASLVEKLEVHPVMKSIMKQRERVDVVFHLSNPSLFQTKTYRDWMGTLPGKQVVVKNDHGCKEGLDIGLRHVLDRGVRLNLVAPGIFPLPESLADPPPEVPLRLPANADLAWMMTSVVCNGLNQKPKLVDSAQKPVDLDSFWKELMSVSPRLRKEVEDLQEIGLLHWDSFSTFYSSMLLNQCDSAALKLSTRPSSRVNLQAATQYARLIAFKPFPPALPRMLEVKSGTGVFFLGTGCSEPSAWRGGSGILLRVEEAGMSLMIDAGEGTYGQLIRYFGEDEAQKMVDSIGCIWISHQHGDHCLGLSALIKNRSAHSSPVLVIAPARVIQHLQLANRSFQLNAILLDTKQQNNNKNKFDFENRIGFSSFLSIRVDHSCEAYGLVIQHHQGWKLVYSGDTRPCANLRHLGDHCTLLIHEATHAPTEASEAIRSKHSTWREALDEGRMMNAYRTILTHFSRRYPYLPTGLTPEELRQDSSIAFDGMDVPFAMLPFLPTYNAAVYEALKEIEEGQDIEMSEDSGM